MIDYLISFNFLDWIGIIGSLMIAGHCILSQVSLAYLSKLLLHYILLGTQLKYLQQ